MMNKNDLYEKVEDMKEMMGSELFLEELLKAMDSEELEENLNYIARMNDLDGLN